MKFLVGVPSPTLDYATASIKNHHSETTNNDSKRGNGSSTSALTTHLAMMPNMKLSE